MSILVTDAGFGPDDWTRGFDGAAALELAPETDPATLEIAPEVEMIRIHFPSFADGRGFTLARLLRLRGYKGRLRAEGHVISDQYAMARRAGFDEVEISDDLAARQPEEDWRFRSNWQQHDYQSRLRG
ncbi:DUF934 domain-containing protein [Salipiger sp. P9]|uniref:DUF934 domain-containing protein n=1 Tax=Salipiger pentaromativorans TaxID=2943193 RepID=UPI00215866E1|nr:DUF934 domain-containing protein [Salipiger pentaromativorans]MCR8547052.1 DUF934 domain-containing protein [Salipiger pentaromativorans]